MMKTTQFLGKRLCLALAFVAALLTNAISVKAQSYSITGTEILNSSDWQKESGRWTEYGSGIYDYAGSKETNTDLISPLMETSEKKHKITVNGYNNGGSASVFKLYYSTDKTNWTLAKDLSTNMNNTTGSPVDMSAEFEVEGNYYVKLECNKVFIITVSFEDLYSYDVDQNKMFEQFNSSSMPEDWTSTGTWYFNSSYGAYCTSWSTAYTLITPKLNFAEGDYLYFDAKHYSSSYNRGVQVKVSSDGTTWSDPIFDVSALTSDWKTYRIAIPSSDIHYVQFSGTYLCLDNIYGGEFIKEPIMNVAVNDLQFGLTKEDVTKTITIENNGRGELTGIIATSDSKYFEVSETPSSIEGKSSANLKVTMKATEPGTYTGKVTITAEGQETFEVALVGMFLDPDKFYEDFSAANDEWRVDDGWRVQNGYVQIGYTNSAKSIVTPLLQFEESDKLYFKAKNQYDDATLTLYYTTDNDQNSANWTKLAEPKFETYGEWKEFIVDVPSEAKCIAFTGTYISIDDVYGGKLPMAPNMKVDMKSYDFGFVKDATEISFTISNKGRAELTNIEVVSDNDAYTFDNVPTSLAAGAEQEVKIMLITSKFEEQNATITISADEFKGENAAKINLTAFVVNPDKFFIDFRTDDMPSDWINQNNQFEFKTGDDGYMYTSYAMSLLTMSKLVVNEGDKFYFTAKSGSSYSAQLAVYYKTSEDGSWVSTPLINLSSNDFNTDEYKIYVLENAPAGDIYLGFNGKYVYIQQMYGYSNPTDTETLELSETAASELTTGVKDVTLQYTVKEGKWNTIALPFAVSDLSVFGNNVKAFAFTGHADNELKFGKVTALEAGKPYLLWVETANENNGNFTFDAADITATEAGKSEFNGAALVATYAPIAAGSMTDTWYGVTPDGKIMKAGSKASLKGYRAYMTLPENVDASSLMMMFDDQALGIKAIDGTDAENDAIYNISGQRVANTAMKGIYIVNGKKVIK